MKLYEKFIKYLIKMLANCARRIKPKIPKVTTIVSSNGYIYHYNENGSLISMYYRPK